MRQAHLRAAAPVVVRSLGDVRLRADIAATLGVLGVKDVAPALRAQLLEERYVSARAAEAAALVSLGAREELRAPLERFAGVPEPLPEVVDLAARAGLLVAPSGWRADGGHVVDGGAAVPLVATLALKPAAAAPGDAGAQASGVRLLLAVTKDEAPVHVTATPLLAGWRRGARSRRHRGHGHAAEARAAGARRCRRWRAVLPRDQSRAGRGGLAGEARPGDSAAAAAALASCQLTLRQVFPAFARDLR